MDKTTFYHKSLRVLLAFLLFAGGVREVEAQQTIFADDWGLKGDGVTDDQAALKTLFHTLKNKRGTNTVIFSPKTYYLGCNWTNTLIEIPSHCTVHAYGASFLFPTNLPVPNPNEYAQQRLFQDVGVTNFAWRGGTFIGFAFDPYHVGGYKQNGWLPAQGVLPFRILSSTNLPSSGLSFVDVSVIRNGSAFIYASGESQGFFNSENSNVGTTDQYVDGVRIINCHFANCGSFWWGYGWLWQISTWATNYPSDLVEMADVYISSAYKYAGLATTSNSPIISLPPGASVPKTPLDGSDNYTVSFYGTNLPNEIVRGQHYYLRPGANQDGFSVSTTYSGTPINFASNVTDIKMFYNLQQVYFGFAVPAGSGINGVIALFDCKNVDIFGNTISGLGDTTRIFRSRDVNIKGNFVNGTRMGGLFAQGYCSRLNIVGNIIDGGDGSLCLDLGALNSDVVIKGNTFTNGGRGCNLNASTNLVIEGNRFANNVNKGNRDWNRGIRNYYNGDWSLFNQISFLPYNGAGFSNVVFEGNVVTNSSPPPANMMSLATNPDQFLLSNNLLWGSNQVVQIQGGASSLALSLDARVGIPFQANYLKPGGSVISPITGPKGYSFSLDGSGNPRLVWTPMASDNGTTNDIIFQQVLPGSSVTNLIDITVTVSPKNTPPTIATIPIIYGEPGFETSFQVTAGDAEATTNGLTYALLNAPTNMSIDPQTGLLTWLPHDSEFDSTYTSVIEVTDSSTPPFSSFTPINFASVSPANLICTLSSNGIVGLGGDTNSPYLLLVQTSPSITNISPIGLNGSGFVVDPTTNRALSLNPGPAFFSGVYIRRSQ